MDLLYRLRDAGIEADVVAGHSLGEYAAAHAAGSLGLGDGVRLVAERDRLMNEASQENPGGMVALIGADPDAVAEAAGGSDGVVVAANFNTPRQTVVSGRLERWTRSRKVCGGARYACRWLALPFPAHGGGSQGDGRHAGRGRVR